MTPYPWAGAGIALVLAAPNVIYQMSHDFPQLQMIAALNAANTAWVRWTLLPTQFLVIVMGLQSFLLAAGFVLVAPWLRGAAWRRPVFIVGLALNSATSALITLPITPSSSFFASINPDQIGWPGYVQQLAAVYHDLPEEDQRRAVIFASNYAEAGAVHRFGPEHGLPSVYSGNNQLWFYGPPPPDRTVVVAWYRRDEQLMPFTDCVMKATLHNDERVGQENGSRVAVCRLPANGWAEVWPQVKFYGTWPYY